VSVGPFPDLLRGLISSSYVGYYLTLQSRAKCPKASSCPFVELYISASDCKGVGNNPRSHFVKAFSALLSHS
jgi:hypothetical protein